VAPFFELLDINLIQLVRRLDLKTYWALTPQMAMPQNANPFLERSHVAAFSRCAGSSIQHRWSTIAFRPLVVVMTCARCKGCPKFSLCATFRANTHSMDFPLHCNTRSQSNLNASIESLHSCCNLNDSLNN